MQQRCPRGCSVRFPPVGWLHPAAAGTHGQQLGRPLASMSIPHMRPQAWCTPAGFLAHSITAWLWHACPLRRRSLLDALPDSCSAELVLEYEAAFVTPPGTPPVAAGDTAATAADVPAAAEVQAPAARPAAELTVPAGLPLPMAAAPAVAAAEEQRDAGAAEGPRPADHVNVTQEAPAEEKQGQAAAGRAFPGEQRALPLQPAAAATAAVAAAAAAAAWALQGVPSFPISQGLARPGAQTAAGAAHGIAGPGVPLAPAAEGAGGAAGGNAVAAGPDVPAPVSPHPSRRQERDAATRWWQRAVAGPLGPLGPQAQQQEGPQQLQQLLPQQGQQGRERCDHHWHYGPLQDGQSPAAP